MKDSKVLELQELVTRAKVGETAAFGRIVVRFQRRIYGFAFNQLNDPIDAEEVVQETFLRAFSRLPTLRDSSKFGSWLFTICKNCAVEKLRTKQRETASESIMNITYVNVPMPVSLVPVDEPNVFYDCPVPVDEVVDDRLTGENARFVGIDGTFYDEFIIHLPSTPVRFIQSSVNV